MKRLECKLCHRRRWTRLGKSSPCKPCRTKSGDGDKKRTPRFKRTKFSAKPPVEKKEKKQKKRGRE